MPFRLLQEAGLSVREVRRTDGDEPDPHEGVLLEPRSVGDAEHISASLPEQYVCHRIPRFGI